jgi:hypothetical protein
MYTRLKSRVCFLLPTLAIGVDADGRYFIEAGWLWFAVRLGDAP